MNNLQGGSPPQLEGHFQIIDDRTIRFNGRMMRMGRADDIWPDGTWLSLEGSEKPRFDSQQRLRVSELNGILGSEFPEGLDLSIEEPRFSTPAIRWLNIQRSAQRIIAILDIAFDFSSWQLPSNLTHFAGLLAQKLELTLTDVHSVAMRVDEYGPAITCKVLIEDKGDIGQLVNQADREIGAAILEAMRPDGGSQISKPSSTPTLKPDEAGALWWLRYAIVPLVIAVVVAFARLL